MLSSCYIYPLINKKLKTILNIQSSLVVAIFLPEHTLLEHNNFSHLLYALFTLSSLFTAYTLAYLIYTYYTYLKRHRKAANERTYFVTLNILNSRRALRTDSPNEPDFTADHMTSKIEPQITTQSNLLKADSK